MSDHHTGALQSALSKAFPLPEYATFFEVADATGARHSRWADAVSMAIWPSRGLLVWGFEIKASRSDWLREKKNPEKSCAVQQYCDRWALITAPGVIADGELPETWGHAELTGGRLVWKKPAPKLEPVALRKPFVAALLRRCGEASETLVGARVEAAVAARMAGVEDRVRERLTNSGREENDAREAVRRFKEVSGIDLYTWNAEETARAFGAFQAMVAQSRYLGLRGLGKNLRDLASRADTLLDELQQNSMEVRG